MKNLDNDKIRFVWDAVHRSKLNYKQICVLLNIRQDEYKRLYAEALKKFGDTLPKEELIKIKVDFEKLKNFQPSPSAKVIKFPKEKRKLQVPVYEKKIIRFSDDGPKQIVRPKAQYSNHSPMGIANPGMGN